MLRRLGQQPPHVAVELQLRVRVHVERTLARGVLDAAVRQAVDRCAGGVDQRDPPLQAPVEDLPRVRVIVVHHVAAVGLGRVGAGALVKHGVGAPEGRAPADRAAELLAVDVIGELAAGQVPELVAVGQVIDSDDIFVAACVQGADEVAADEPGGAGDHDRPHRNPSAIDIRPPRHPGPTRPRTRCRSGGTGRRSPSGTP